AGRPDYAERSARKEVVAARERTVRLKVRIDLLSLERRHFSGDYRCEMPAGPRFASWTRPQLFLLGGGLGAGCRCAAVRVSLGFHMGLSAARNPLPMDVLLGDRVAFFVHFFMDRHFAVIPASARCHRCGGCGRAWAGYRS